MRQRAAGLERDAVAGDEAARDMRASGARRRAAGADPPTETDGSYATRGAWRSERETVDADARPRARQPSSEIQIQSRVDRRQQLGARRSQRAPTMNPDAERVEQLV